ncbi:MAG: ribonuclease III [Betaproteobacteria bacterium]|nr:ribonuclease III [Betaproteobacteria bacterium]
MAKPLQALEQRLGHLFSSSSLLTQALTHRSFGVPNNERLEFLGDSVLNCAISQRIYDRFPEMPEGELSRYRANLVNQSMLAEIAAELAIGPMLRLGEGELKTGGAERPSILADAFEALIGAICLDAGFSKASDVVDALFSSRLDATGAAKPGKDSKTTLQEWLQARRMPLPDYHVQRIEGEAHKQVFHVQCEIPQMKIVTLGDGPSRRMAERVAAAKAIALLPKNAGVDA